MAKAVTSVIIKDLYGSAGNTVFRRTRSGTVTVMKRPDMSKVKWTKDQQAARERFRQAVAYAREVMRDPKKRSEFEKKAKKTGRTVYHLAITEYFRKKG
ncbi:MAG: hypothetical protein AABZ39_07040 [Spirochaetota bacterium]